MGKRNKNNKSNAEVKVEDKSKVNSNEEKDTKVNTDESNKSKEVQSNEVKDKKTEGKDNSAKIPTKDKTRDELTEKEILDSMGKDKTQTYKVHSLRTSSLKGDVVKEVIKEPKQKVDIRLARPFIKRS